MAPCSPARARFVSLSTYSEESPVLGISANGFSDLIVQDAVVKIEEFLFRYVADSRLADAIDVAGQPLSSAVVINDDLQKVRHGRDGLQILLGPIDWVEGVVVPDVPPDPDVAIGCFAVL